VSPRSGFHITGTEVAVGAGVVVGGVVVGVLTGGVGDLVFAFAF
jgi:hypothetical protein